ncbi:MAG: sulfurtransferase TusA family protein [Geminicoccaceae bacterium]|nr:sulfurtransferase TusA family protein [Geminicoccaceae bacterium]
MEQHELDARGLSCPLPVLKAQKRLRALAAGDRLVVLATDPKAPGDFTAFCEERGHSLQSIDETGGFFTVTIEKKG